MKSKQKGEAMVVALGVVVMIFTFIHNYTINEVHESYEAPIVEQESVSDD